jgi:hypothetical protein
MNRQKQQSIVFDKGRQPLANTDANKKDAGSEKVPFGTLTNRILERTALPRLKRGSFIVMD